PWPGQRARETPVGRQSRWPASSPHRGSGPRNRQSIPPPVPPHDPSSGADTVTGSPDPRWETTPPGPLDFLSTVLSPPERWNRNHPARSAGFPTHRSYDDIDIDSQSSGMLEN